MTTTAYDDQFASEPEPVHQQYDVAAILRKNVADLEKELQRQKERAEKAEAELNAAREQKPVAWMHDKDGRVDTCHDSVKELWLKVGKSHNTQFMREIVPCRVEHYTIPLYARPIPAPAVPTPEIPDGDDFNGTTPHLIQCIESLVRMNDSGVLVPHGIGGHARTLLLASANRLRQQPAPAAPDRLICALKDLKARAYKQLDHGKGRAVYIDSNAAIDIADALLQSAGGGK